MARRIRIPTWPKSLQRTFGALTRQAVRSGTRAVLKASTKTVKRAVKRAVKGATKAAVARRTPPTGPGTWISGVALGGAGARRYRLYRPPDPAPAVGAGRPVAKPAVPRPALLVMLHGCGQDAIAFARSTRMHRLAAREGFWVLYPEQERLANAQGCWNWFDTRSGRAQAEAASIVAAIDQVVTRYRIDAGRVAVAGISAGASLAALLGTRYPARFQAVAMHSGIAPGAATSSATAIGAMQGRRTAPPFEGAGGAALPPLLVIQGSADGVVAPANGRAAALWWATAMGAHAIAPRTVQRGQRYPATLSEFKCAARVVVGLTEVAGLAHAWSGGAAGQPYSDARGPDAARMIWAFVERQWRGRAAAA